MLAADFPRLVHQGPGIGAARFGEAGLAGQDVGHPEGVAERIEDRLAGVQRRVGTGQVTLVTEQ